MQTKFATDILIFVNEASMMNHDIQFIVVLNNLAVWLS